MPRRCRICLLAALCLLAVSAFASGAAEAACRLQVGWEPWEPYTYRTAAREVTGLDIELTRLILAEAGCEAVPVERPWTRLLAEIVDGRVDVLPGATRTPEREGLAAFSGSYRTEEVRLAMRKDAIPSVAAVRLSALIDRGFRLAVVRGYTYGPEVGGWLADPARVEQFQVVNDEASCLRLLIAGRVGGFIADRAVMRHLLDKEKVEDQIGVHPIPVFSTQIHLMLGRKTVTETQRMAIDAAITRVLATAPAKALFARYLDN